MASNRKDYDPDLAGDIPTAGAKLRQRQNSFDSTNLPAQYLTPSPKPAQAPTAGPVGRVTQQIATQPDGVTPRSSINLADAHAYPTGIGDGKKAIYAGVGANGEASFSSTPSSINSIDRNYQAPNVAPEQRLTSLSQDWQIPAGAPQTQQGPLNLANARLLGSPNTSQSDQSTARSDPSFASLGSVRNLGDGQGTFSQSAPGDAALASGRFQRAIDLRDAYQNQDRLRAAVANQTRDRNFNVVSDSSRPVTQRELLSLKSREATTKGLADAVAGAQGVVDNGRQGIAAEQQQRQALRLEDAYNLATAPNATDAQRSSYRTMADPLNERGIKRQAAEADIAYKNARAENYRVTAEKTARTTKGLPAGLQKLEDADIEAVGVTKTMNGALDKISSQIADGSLQLGVWANTVSSARNAAGVSDDTSANYSSMVSTMEKLRNESLRLNKGTQTEGDADRAWNELFTNIRDPKIVQQRIKEINGYNNQAAIIRGAMVNNRRANQGLDELNVDDLLGGVSQGQRPDQAQQPSPSQGTQATSPVRVAGPDDVARLPSGATFVAPDGSIKRKP